MSRDLFDSHRVAAGYARSRPRFHAGVLERMARQTAAPASRRALDVGCGTGLSTLALRHAAHCAVGIDSSTSMLASAEQSPAVGYAAAPAECLPFRRSSFDLITVAGAINWIDRDCFLPEARRVLVPAGRLWIYDGAELGRMDGVPAYADWYQDQYQSRLPRPPRDETPVTAAEARSHGFELRLAETYELQFICELSAWVEFLMTQSCVTHAVSEGRETLEEVHDWIYDSLERHFGGQRQSMLFGGPMWCLHVEEED